MSFFKILLQHRRAATVLLLSIVLLGAMSMFLVQRLKTLDEGGSWVEHSQRVRFELAEVLQSMTDLGAGLNAYLVGHDPDVFAPARRADAALPAQLQALEEIVRDSDIEKPLFDALVLLANRRRVETAELRQRARAGDADAVTKALTDGQARSIMIATRSIVAQLAAEEGRALAGHRRAVVEAYRDAIATVDATAVVAAGLLIAVTVVTLREGERVRRIQDELATTLRSIGDAVISTDSNGRVRFMNDVAQRLTGHDDQASRGRPLAEVFKIINESTRVTVESPVARVLREGSIVNLANHTLLIARDGSERPIEDSGAPIRDAAGQLAGVVLVFRDATFERRARAELRETEAALRSADARKNDFLATLSHELRNPLAPIRTAARLLTSAAVTPAERSQSIAVISRQVGHMAALIDDLMDVARITRGVLILKPSITELRTIIETAIESVRPALEEKRHRLVTEWPDTPIAINVDPVRLTQVVTNLLTNAVKYTNADGLITIGTRLNEQELAVYVRDTGIGISGAMADQVFEMFAQVQPATERSAGGLGIGLGLAKALVELHGGRLQVFSAGTGQGSEFTVLLPSTLVSARIDPPQQATAAAAAAAGGHSNVLIADDNRDAAEILGMLLEASGHSVTVAYNGLEAIEKAKAFRPRILVLDIGMPGLNGYEVAKQVRQETWGHEAVLIAMTGWGQEDDKRKAAAAGFDHHLTKPVDPDVLERLIATS